MISFFFSVITLKPGIPPFAQWVGGGGQGGLRGATPSIFLIISTLPSHTPHMSHFVFLFCSFLLARLELSVPAEGGSCLTQCTNSIVLESQLPHTIVNTLLQSAIVNNELTI